MICITMEPGCLKVEGHAGFAPHGQDILCAAVSALSYTLLEHLKRVFPDELKYRATEGCMEIRCEDNELTRAAFAFAEDGFRPLAQQYPGYIQFLKKSGGGGI